MALVSARATDFRLNPMRIGLPDQGWARYHRGMKMPRFALIAACLLILAACGNKGPLVLPQTPATASPQEPLSPPSEPAPTPADSATEEVPASPQNDGDGTPR